MGEVHGRGPQVAIGLSRVGRAIRMAAVQHLDPGEMLRSVNEALLDKPYSTLALALVKPTAGCALAVVAHAGHCAPLIRRADGSVTEVDATGRPLGVAPDGEFRVGALALRPADALASRIGAYAIESRLDIADKPIRHPRGGGSVSPPS